MRQAVLSRRPGAAKSQSLSLPSPIGGLNARDSVANMKGTDALQMDNWFPQTTDVAVRRGYTAFATFSGAGWTYTNVPLGTENRFPSWRQVIPNDKPAATLECVSADLSRAAGDVMAVCAATKAVIVDVSADAATVQTPKDAEPSFSAEIAGKITGSVRTALPAKQLRDALAQCSGRVAVTLLGALDPARVDSGEAFFAILMPWRGL